MRNSRLSTPKWGRLGSAVTSLRVETQPGDDSAAKALFRVLYSELHRLAKRELARHGGALTVSPTTLLHEAYLDMAERPGPQFPDRGRFMAYAARVMRGVMIDHARSRQAIKRGGQFELTTLNTEVGEKVADARELAQISEALDELAKTDPSLAEIVDLKFFCGFSFAEIAAMQGTCERTVQRKWEKARIYLHHSVRPGPTLVR